MWYKSVRSQRVKFDASTGIVEAIVSVTGNKDLQGDVIMPGAFSKALLTNKAPKIVFQHDWDFPLGKTISAVELMPGDKRLPDSLFKAGCGGLLVVGQFTMADPKAAAIFAHLKAGSLDEFSIGFDVPDDGRQYDNKTDTNYLKSIYPLYEWSPVLYGANPATVPVAVKAFVPYIPDPADDEDEEYAQEPLGSLLRDRKPKKKRSKPSKTEKRTRDVEAHPLAFWEPNRGTFKGPAR